MNQSISGTKGALGYILVSLFEGNPFKSDCVNLGMCKE